MMKKTLPLLIALALAGCVQPTEPEPAPAVDANGVEALPTDEVITEDQLLS